MLRLKKAKITLRLLHFFIISLLITGFYLTIASTFKTYASMDSSLLSTHIDEFMSAGAKGFLVWQYSGFDENGKFASDQYSFYRGTPDGDAICAVLKQKSEQYSEGFVGVNIWNLGALEYDQAKINEHLTWLNTTCGVKVVRIFAKADWTNGVLNALKGANGSGVELIVAIGDYSNGSGRDGVEIMPLGAGKEWYLDEYKINYRPYAIELVNAIRGSGLVGNLYGLELANEPHCGGKGQETVEYYKNWGIDIGQILKTITPNVGYGQMANPNGLCDSPSMGGFITTNDIDQISMTSAHYYNEIDRQESLKALSQSKEINKSFYIGEAGWDDSAELEDREITPKDRDDYFVYPLNFVTKPTWRTEPLAGVDSKTNFTIFNLAYDQGYQVLCPAEKITINKNVLGNIDKYFELNKQTYEEGSDYDLKVSAGNAKIPLYRGNEISEETNKISSLEGYFGASRILEEDSEEQPNTMLDDGVASNLLTLQQQCQLKFENSMVINEMCLMLEDPAQCSLNKLISNTEFTPSGLYFEMEKYLHGNNGLEPVSCSDWVLPWTTFSEIKPRVAKKMSEERFEKVQEGLKNMSLNTDLAYRMAYIVITPLQNPNDGSDPFWFLADLTKNSPSHVPIIIGIKIPDFLTNPSYTHSLVDSAVQTTNNLGTLKDQKEKYNDEVGRRKDFLNSIANAQNIRSQNSQKSPTDQERQIINCTDMDQCTKSTEDIPVYIKEALIDMINGEGNACDGGSYKIEDAGDIFSYGDATIKAGSRNFVGEYLNAIIPQNNSQNFEWGVKINSGGEARSNFINPAFNPKSSENIPVMVHMIAPLGVTINQVQERLWFAFTIDQRSEMEPTTPDYYPLTGIDFGFNDKISQKFWNPDKDCGTTYDEFGFPISKAPCDNDNFSIELTDKDSEKGLTYPGAKIGWLIRKIQESVNTIGSATYNYVASCKTTEDMFLGRCEGGSRTSDPINTLVAVAQCTGSGRFTTGEGSNHVYIDSSQSCTKFCAPNAGIICTQDPSADHDIPNWKNPNDPHAPCDVLYSPIACVSERTLIENKVNKNGQFDKNGTMTACEYVVEKAKEAGVSPRFALAMWGEESGFSHFRVPDFGVISQPRQDLGKQVSAFLRTVNSHDTLLEFYEAYSGETRGSNAFCNNKAFVARMDTFYTYLDPANISWLSK